MKGRREERRAEHERREEKEKRRPNRGEMKGREDRKKRHFGGVASCSWMVFSALGALKNMCYTYLSILTSGDLA